MCRGAGCLLGPGGSLSPEKPGAWVPLLRDLRAALELKRLKWSGAGTCSDSARLLLRKLRPGRPRALCRHSPPLCGALGSRSAFVCILSCSWRDPGGQLAVCPRFTEEEIEAGREVE